MQPTNPELKTVFRLVSLDGETRQKVYDGAYICATLCLITYSTLA